MFYSNTTDCRSCGYHMPGNLCLSVLDKCLQSLGLRMPSFSKFLDTTGAPTAVPPESYFLQLQRWAVACSWLVLKPSSLTSISGFGAFCEDGKFIPYV